MKNKYFEVNDYYTAPIEEETVEEPEESTHIPEEINKTLDWFSESEFINGAIYFGKGESAVSRNLRIFRENRTPDNLYKFLRVCASDINYRIADEFRSKIVKYYKPASEWKLTD
jgi:hypothetical protein